MKKAAALLLILAAALCLGLSGCAKYTHIVITSQRFGDFYCSVYEDETVEIVKYMGEEARVEVPAGINSRTVVDISTRAFENCDTVEEVFLPASLTTLPSKLFDGCDNLRAVYIPLTVKTIGKNLVSDCPAFTTVRYAGTEAQWNAVSKGNALTENYLIANAQMEFEYSVGD